MAKFCTLCGSNDIDIIGIYNSSYKPIPTLKKIIKGLGDNFFSSNVGEGIKCDRCGLSSFGINRKFEIYAGYINTDEIVKIGKIDQRNMNLNLFDVNEIDKYKNLKDKSEIIEPIKIPKLEDKQNEIRNTIERILNLSDPEIENQYNIWKDNDLSNSGLCSVLLKQLKKEEQVNNKKT